MRAAAAVRCVRAWGTACFVGERGQVTLDVSADLLRRQVTLVGSWTFSKQGQAECAELSPSATWTWSGSSRTDGS